MDGTDFYLGTIWIFAGAYQPNGWMSCQGQSLSIRTNTALFAVIGTRFGGDGVNTFNLPDLSGRRAIQAGQGEDLEDYTFGEEGGSETLELVSADLPPHSHGSPTLDVYRGPFATNFLGDTDSPVTAVPAPVPNTSAYAGTADTTMGATEVLSASPSAGQGQPIANMSPYLVMNYIIAINGIYPPRPD